MLKMLFVVQLCSTWYLVGLIWIIQIVHYAMFDQIGEEQFTTYEADHQRRITPIVGPPMLLELITSVTLAWMLMGDQKSPIAQAFPTWAAWLGVGLVIGIWLTTAFVSVPFHQKLSTGFDPTAFNGLVNTNWIRTAFWTIRGLLCGWALWRLLP